MKYWNEIDIMILIILAFIACSIGFIFHPSYLVSTLIFFGIPSIYLSIRTPHAIILAFLFSLIFTISIGAIIENIAIINNFWIETSIFKYRILGNVPIETFVWSLSEIYLIIIFYEHFFDKGGHKVSNKHLKYFIIISLLISLLYISFEIFIPNILKGEYLYMKLGFIGVLFPVLAFLFKFPKYASKFLKTIPYFSFLFLLNEIASLTNGYWKFTSHDYIGWILIYNFKFPIEEALFFICLSSAGIITYFEFFEDSKVKWNMFSAKKKHRR